ncbi:hypothetical protein HDU96_005997 [Phlyctochytrium bullatum]|nr:hypothetical protein HDU96_005997 [Phlyctochytrium bullatum]
MLSGIPAPTTQHHGRPQALHPQDRARCTPAHSHTACAFTMAAKKHARHPAETPAAAVCPRSTWVHGRHTDSCATCRTHTFPACRQSACSLPGCVSGGGAGPVAAQPAAAPRVFTFARDSHIFSRFAWSLVWFLQHTNASPYAAAAATTPTPAHFAAFLASWPVDPARLPFVAPGTAGFAATHARGVRAVSRVLARLGGGGAATRAVVGAVARVWGAPPGTWASEMTAAAPETVLVGGVMAAVGARCGMQWAEAMVGAVAGEAEHGCGWEACDASCDTRIQHGLGIVCCNGMPTLRDRDADPDADGLDNDDDGLPFAMSLDDRELQDRDLRRVRARAPSPDRGCAECIELARLLERIAGWLGAREVGEAEREAVAARMTEMARVWAGVSGVVN